MMNDQKFLSFDTNRLVKEGEFSGFLDFNPKFTVVTRTMGEGTRLSTNWE
jgi:hypothetical protein